MEKEERTESRLSPTSREILRAKGHKDHSEIERNWEPRSQTAIRPRWSRVSRRKWSWVALVEAAWSRALVPGRGWGWVAVVRAPNSSSRPVAVIFAVSPMEWRCCLGSFPNWDSRCAMIWDLPGLIKSGYWSKPNLPCLRHWKTDLNDPDDDGVITQSQTSWSAKSSGP